MKALSKQKMDRNNLIEELLNSISVEESLRIENRMLMAAKIEDALKAKGWKKKDLMEALGKKNQSEITKWLSGTHNFTQDILTDLGRVLGIELLNLGKEKYPIIEKTYRTTTVSVHYKTKQPRYINEMFLPETIPGNQYQTDKK